MRIPLDVLRACANELHKIAAMVPVQHGTSQAWDVLRAGVGKTVLKNDPNPRAVWMSMRNSRLTPSISQFAHEAARAKDGKPLIAQAKVDTKKGWRPRALTEWGRKNIGSLEDAHDLVDELDSGATGTRRGEIWKSLHMGTGSWANADPSTVVKPARYVNALPLKSRLAATG